MVQIALRVVIKHMVALLQQVTPVDTPVRDKDKAHITLVVQRINYYKNLENIT